jgi:hypothetical protein
MAAEVPVISTEIRCVRHGRKVTWEKAIVAPEVPIITHTDGRPCGSGEYVVTIIERRVIGKNSVLAEILAEEARNG